ncbi:hypothetical protein [Streptomyces sp. NPDC056190]|uniref:hypothetical protein n=1 Tax=Streptomyces sp. NPDC056190 TaxID=3345741 RepID=UPI0035D88A52
MLLLLGEADAVVDAITGRSTVGGHGSWLEPELNTGWPSAAFESVTLWHPEETQKDFAVAVKAFHESSSFTFIGVGVWLQENRLVQFNGDLSGRIATINADKWLRSELGGGH